MDVAVFDEDRSNAWALVEDHPGADDLAADLPVAPGAEVAASRRRWRGFAVGAGLVLLLIALTVTSLGWNSEKGRADELAVRLTTIRAELKTRDLEASNLRKEVSNLHEDKKVLNTYVDELQGEQDDLQLHNDDLSSTNEAINSVVRQLAQCLTEMREIGGQLMRNPQAVAEERIRRAATQCAAAQAAAAVLKATTGSVDGKPV